MEVFRRLPRGTSEKIKEMRDKKAMEIREKWLNKNYFFGASTPATKSGLKKVNQMLINSHKSSNLDLYI